MHSFGYDDFSIISVLEGYLSSEYLYSNDFKYCIGLCALPRRKNLRPLDCRLNFLCCTDPEQSWR